MTYNNWVYIAVMAAVSYAIRVLPLTLIRKPIKNQFIQSFLYYVPYVTLAVMTFPAIINATQSPIARCRRAGSGHRRRMVRSQSVSGVRLLLCRGACAGTVFGALSFLPLWFWVGHGGFLVFEIFSETCNVPAVLPSYGRTGSKTHQKEGCAHGAPQF